MAKKKEVKAHVSKEKKKTVEDLKKLMKENRTMLFASVKNLPGSQFQEIKKKFRGDVTIKVPKKNLLFRAIDETGEEGLKVVKEIYDNSIAILFSNNEAYDLSADLLKNKSPAKAKAGQEAITDIEVQEGPTELVPGPAVSELGGLGIEIKIEKGKISIAKSKIIVKAGNKISQGAADVMAKLDIKPFSIGYIPIGAYDMKEHKFFREINIDRDGFVAKLKYGHSRALPFAVEIGYPSQDTIRHIIVKGHTHAKALEKYRTSEIKSEEEK
jgi:ribosomal protein L10